MFNPFKKKEENDFNMNEMELPSLNDMDQSPMDNNSMPELPNLDSNPSENNFQQDIENTPGLSGMQEMNSTPSFEDSENNSQINSNPTNPFANESSSSQNSTGNNSENNNFNDNQQLHNEISKTKLDSLGSKMELLEHRVQNIDNKLDLILKLIQAEVSTETKMKVNMDDKMNQFR